MTADMSELHGKVIEWRLAWPSQRLGQAYYIVASDLFPEQVDLVQLTVDPFYDDNKLPSFLLLLGAYVEIGRMVDQFATERRG